MWSFIYLFVNDYIMAKRRRTYGYDNLMGSYVWKGKKDLFNIVMIGLAKELPGRDEQNELHRLLGALLSKELTIDEKLRILNIIGNEYEIPVEENFRKDVSV